jgi:RHS repeat-associated protein
LPKTRVWGPGSEKQAFIGPPGQLSSTLRWGCGYIYGGTASGSTDQRFYASGYGRFNSPDPSTSSIKPSSPQTWHRYSYTFGDPVNRTDRHGTVTECDPNDPDCCDPSSEDCSCGDPCNPSCIDAVANPGWGLIPIANDSCGEPGPDPGPAPEPGPACTTFQGAIDTYNCVHQGGGTGWSTVSAEFKTIQSIKQSDPTCYDWLDSKTSARNLDVWLSNLPYRVAIADSITDAGVPDTTTAATYTFRPPVLNLDGHNVPIIVNWSVFSTLTSSGQMLTLLHEIGHALKVLLPDGAGGQNTTTNNDQVEAHCAKTIGQ